MPETNPGRFLHTCKKGYAQILKKELSLKNFIIKEIGEDWILTEKPSGVIEDFNLCWATLSFIAPTEIKETSVNGQSQKLFDAFAHQIKDKKINDMCFMSVAYSQAIEGLGKRSKAVQTRLQERIKKQFSRISKLLREPVFSAPASGEGFFMYWINFNRLVVCQEIITGGQHRVKDDPAAPSRSFMKIEEAYGILGKRPKVNEIVVDLGAAPGGFSYSAIKHGANVLAVDHGPLKGICQNHPLIEHIREDAFKFKIAKKADWLFCDMVENPYQILELLKIWISNNGCRQFVLNLKIGQIDQHMFVERLNQEIEIIGPYCLKFLARQLYHDRDEITLMGILNPNKKKAEN